MNVPQKEKAAAFRKLHDGPGAFVIPNPWDIASARILDGLGFQALATSSAASACAIGLKDGELTRDQALEHARMIVDATDLPVSNDLERGFGEAPKVVAETIRLAAEAGLVGCTIEDTTGNPTAPLYETTLAVERIAAAAAAARSLPFPFMLTARAQFSLSIAQPPRHHQPLASVRKSRCRCAVRSRIARSRHCENSLCVTLQAVQFHGRNQRKIIHCGRAGCGWCTPY